MYYTSKFLKLATFFLKNLINVGRMIELAFKMIDSGKEPWMDAETMKRNVIVEQHIDMTPMRYC